MDIHRMESFLSNQLQLKQSTPWPIPSCPILSLWAHLSGSSAVLHLVFNFGHLHTSGLCLSKELLRNPHLWLPHSPWDASVPLVTQLAMEMPLSLWLVNPEMSPYFFSPIWCVLQPHWLIDWSIPLYTLIPSHHTCVCVSFCTILSHGCNSM